jgi:O-antigen/teichoic acid export membrane protein
MSKGKTVMHEHKSLKKKTISSLLWSSSGLIADQGIRFIILIVLARLLMPTDFGIIGMITVFIAVSQSIIDSGLKNALIREKDSTQDDYSTVFYFNLLMAVLLYGILFITAPIISEFFGEPQIISILRVLSFVVIINSFGLIQRTILVKKIDFKSQTKISVMSSVLSGVIAIICAYLGFGVWSLVIQTLVMQFIQSLLLSLSNKWVPSLVFSIDSFKRLFGFGWKLLVSGLINTLYQNIYYVIIGKFFSASMLGYYTNAQKLRDVASQSITTSVQKVSYPVLSKFQDDKKLKKGYQKIIKSSVFITFPLMIGLAAVADPLINLLFGDNWVKSISYFQILCFAGMLFPLHAINLNILQVKGRSDLFLRLEILKKVLGIGLIALVLSLKLGIIGLIWAAVLNSFIAFFINSYYSANLLAYSTKDQIKDILPIALVSTLMGGIVFVMGTILPDNNLIRLVLLTIVGVSSYIGFCKLFKIEEVKTVQDTIKSFIGKFAKKVRTSN